MKMGRRTASTGCWWSRESSEKCDARFSSLPVMPFRTNIKQLKLHYSNSLMSELYLNVYRLCVSNIVSLGVRFNKKALLSQTTARCAQYMGALKFRESSQTPPATFPEICKGLLFRSILRMCIQNLKFVALSVPEKIGVLKKFGQSLYMPTLQFLPNF